MRPHGIQQCLKANKPAINGWLTLPCATVAEVMAHQPFDTLTLDMQHGCISYDAALSMLQAISTTTVTPIVRVPWLEPSIIMKILDAGAYGIICPMIESADDARKLVQYCYYPPKGQRSFGPLRATLYAGNDYAEHANNTIMPIAMIETRGALDNLEEIVNIKGLSGLYIGPFDLSYALACKPQPDNYEQPVLDAIDYILTTAAAHNMPAGIHCITPEYAKKMIDKGFSWVTTGCDFDFIQSGAHHASHTVKNHIQDQKHRQ